jgi:ubiquinone/menaquinone biosynthesis C-methylase UbiE
LNAGSGIDIPSIYLKKKFNECIEIVLLDISENCININKDIHQKCHVQMEYITGNIFHLNLIIDNFDIIYNTGLMEHYSDNDKTEIFKNISKYLLRDGLFLTFNPSDKGLLYKKAKAYAEGKGTWQYGIEMPIKTLVMFDGIAGLKFYKEKDQAALSQLHFLKYYSLQFKYLNCILIILKVPLLYFFIDCIVGCFIGYYIRLSIFIKE